VTDHPDNEPSDQFEPEVDAAAVASRAEGRPREEDSSDDPEAQAEAILTESEERIAERAKQADSSDE
jgi:hypothetical protein